MLLNRTISKEIFRWHVAAPQFGDMRHSKLSLLWRLNSVMFAAGKSSQVISAAGDFIAIGREKAPIFDFP